MVMTGIVAHASVSLGGYDMRCNNTLSVWGVMEELILGSHGDVLAGGDSFQCDTVEVFRLFSGAVGVTGEEGQGCFPG